MSAAGRGAERIESDAYSTPSWCVRRLLEAVALPLEMPCGNPAGCDSAPCVRPAVWVEPCAGDGAIISACHGHFERISGRAMWWANEIRPECAKALQACGVDELTCGDYLQLPARGGDVIITNPPYSIAFEVTRKACSEAPWVALLLRLNALGSGVESGRSVWFRGNPPDVHVLPNRPAYVASGKCSGRQGRGRSAARGADCGWRVTQAVRDPRVRQCPSCGAQAAWSTTDATEYAWFVWPPWRERRAGQITILAETSEAERARG